MSAVAFFDGAANLRGCTLTTARNYATRNFNGAVVAANQPAFAGACSIAPSPPTNSVVTLDSTASTWNLVVCSGLTPNGATTTYIHDRLSGAGRRIARFIGTQIAPDCFTANPASPNDFRANIICNSTPSAVNPVGRKNGESDMLRDLGVGAGEDADWVYGPVAFKDIRGMTVVVCEAKQWSGSAYVSSATAIIHWPHGGTPSLFQRFATVQVGRGRGAQFGTSLWQLPHDPEAAYLLVSDYRYNPGSRGGELYMIRYGRPAGGAITANWQAGQAVTLLNIVGTPGTHIHGATLTTRPNAPGGMSILVDVGDTANARTIALTRPDLNYAQGFVSATTPLLTQPSLVTTTSQTANGWEVEWCASGHPANRATRIHVVNGTWTAATRTMTTTAVNGRDTLQGYNVIVEGGTGTTVGQVTNIESHTGGSTSFVLSDSIAAANQTNIELSICLRRMGCQPVGREVLADGTPVLGSDEATPTVMLARVPAMTGVGDRRLVWESGTSTPGLTTHIKWPLCFYLQRLAPDTSPQHPGRLVAFLNSSQTTVDGWNTATEASRILVSDSSGRQWASAIAPAAGNFTSNVRFCTDGQWIILSVDGSARAYPVPAATATQRPLAASTPACTQHLVASTVALGLEPVGGYTVVAESGLAALGATIPTLSAGEIGRVTTSNDWYVVRSLTGSTYPYATAGVLQFQVCPLSTHHSGRNDLVMRVYDQAAGLFGGEITTRSFTVDGTGWRTVTIPLPARAGSGTFQIAAAIRGQAWGNNHDPLDFLIRWGYVVTGNGSEYPTIALPVTASSQVLPAATSTLTLTQPMPGDWTLVVRGRIPESGMDRHVTNGDTRLFTIVGAAELSARLWFDGSIALARVSDGVVNIDTASINSEPRRNGTFAFAITCSAGRNRLEYAVASDGSTIATGQDIAYTNASDLIGWQTLLLSSSAANPRGVEIFSVEAYPNQYVTFDRLRELVSAVVPPVAITATPRARDIITRPR